MTITDHRGALPRLKTLKGIVWDLDDTLYRLGEITEHAFDVAIAQTALAAGVDLDFDEAVAIANRSYRQYGIGGGHVFVDRYGLDRAAFHRDYHRRIDEKIIEVSAETAALFAQLSLKHALVTHGARNWAERVLAHLGLAAFFPPERIVALEDYGFQHKHVSTAGFDRALAALGLKAADVAMVEDTLRNLQIPHRLGLLTIHLRHGRQAPAADYVDLSADNALDVLEALTA